jgi:hypothetical protein
MRREFIAGLGGGGGGRLQRTHSGAIAKSDILPYACRSVGPRQTRS